MAALLKKSLLHPVLRNNGVARLQFVRLAGYWNKDWKPGPYPKTDAERIAAAKKYGMLPQDYEPYPDDGLGYGDYPKLPLISNDMKDPLYNWDMPDLKRNYGEPIHTQYDAYVEERLSNARIQYTPMYMLSRFLGIMGAFLAVHLLFEYNDWYLKHPWTPPQYIKEGKTHYTFEPLD
ncbi:NADH dehydrogenase [ubiquinone] 1 beta subcomplex subunit 8, mitochondrial-like [Daphnia pulex]|uniref:NADH dehydrogenase [ubiquinone] 1 beta subcomplex subunit 8, mitochondrial-like n=1 Tax=Daphnia pulex TaxID=6669 RepID=UPI001EDFC929|nr:NADH dehydrogenase [ubiquinone] 1 beta subcomplex subunit 8, mitochondrial-like [Daphnia pulex]